MVGSTKSFHPGLLKRWRFWLFNNCVVYNPSAPLTCVYLPSPKLLKAGLVVIHSTSIIIQRISSGNEPGYPASSFVYNLMLKYSEGIFTDMVYGVAVGRLLVFSFFTFLVVTKTTPLAALAPYMAVVASIALTGQYLPHHLCLIHKTMER